MESSARSLQRVGFFALVPSLLHRLGADAYEVIAAAGLEARALEDPDSTIPFHNAGLLMQAAADTANCPHFGLELGKLISINTLGLVGQLVGSAPTLRHAVRIFVANQHRNSHGSLFYLIENEDEALLGFAVYAQDVVGTHLLIDTMAMGMFTAVHEVVDCAATSIEMFFSRSQPANVNFYRRAFGVRLNFDAEHTAIRLPRRLLDQPVRGADSRKFAELEARVQSLWHVGLFSTEAQLRRELRVGLLTSRTSAPEIATALGMNTRMLHRRLEKSGLTFQQALNEARFEFAKQLLGNTSLGVNTISVLVGYSDPSVLTRSFTRWAGISPSEWRKRLDTDLHKYLPIDSRVQH